MNLKVVIDTVKYAALDVDLNCWLDPLPINAKSKIILCEGRVSIPNNSARSRTRSRYIRNFGGLQKSTQSMGRAEDLVASFHRLGTLDDS